MEWLWQGRRITMLTCDDGIGITKLGTILPQASGVRDLI